MKYFLVFIFFLILSCSQERSTQPIDDCITTGDSTRVCGDMEFRLY